MKPAIRIAGALTLAVMLGAGPAWARSHGGGASEHSHRDPAVPHEFQHTHPCPSTASTSGAPSARTLRAAHPASASASHDPRA
jgi:hypothetical protein